jgi:hypothetical protein
LPIITEERSPVNYAALRNALSLGINRRVYYGWVMLGVGGLSVFASGPAAIFESAESRP